MMPTIRELKEAIVDYIHKYGRTHQPVLDMELIEILKIDLLLVLYEDWDNIFKAAVRELIIDGKIGIIGQHPWYRDLFVTLRTKPVTIRMTAHQYNPLASFFSTKEEK